jgi:hypothetical protein
MTDLSPNDLSHLSDAEFQSLCPQGEHAPGPEALSPAAQAVLDAAFSVYDCEALYSLTEKQHASMIAAAAIRELADQVVPHPGRYPMNEYMEGIRNAKHDVRADILAIATELENHG